MQKILFFIILCFVYKITFAQRGIENINNSKSELQTLPDFYGVFIPQKRSFYGSVDIYSISFNGQKMYLPNVFVEYGISDDLSYGTSAILQALFFCPWCNGKIRYKLNINENIIFSTSFYWLLVDFNVYLSTITLQSNSNNYFFYGLQTSLFYINQINDESSMLSYIYNVSPYLKYYFFNNFYCSIGIFVPFYAQGGANNESLNLTSSMNLNYFYNHEKLFKIFADINYIHNSYGFTFSYNYLKIGSDNSTILLLGINKTWGN